jgi:hypothetical protein
VPHQDSFLAPLSGKKKTFARGVSHAHPLLCFKFCFTLFLLASFYQKHKKISIIYSYFYLSTFSFARMATPENQNCRQSYVNRLSSLQMELKGKGPANINNIMG